MENDVVVSIITNANAECYWDGQQVGSNLHCFCANDKPTFYDGQWWFLCREYGIIFGNQRPVLRLRDI